MLRPATHPRALELVRAARKVRQNAYSPYYRVQVGAALLDKNGNIHVGCNVENASGAAHSGCAEANAIVSAVAQGVRDFEAIAVVAFEDTPITPCGPCRQKIFEFAPDLTVILGLVNKDDMQEVTLSELLPYAFKL